MYKKTNDIDTTTAQSKNSSRTSAAYKLHIKGGLNESVSLHMCAPPHTHKLDALNVVELYQHSLK